VPGTYSVTRKKERIVPAVLSGSLAWPSVRWATEGHLCHKDVSHPAGDLMVDA